MLKLPVDRGISTMTTTAATSRDGGDGECRKSYPPEAMRCIRGWDDREGVAEKRGTFVTIHDQQTVILGPSERGGRE